MKKERYFIKGITCILMIASILMIPICSSNIGIITSAEEKAKVDNNIELNKESIASFVNKYFNSKKNEYNVPGVCVAVVKDNKEIFKAGYGYSDVKKKVVANPDTTTFPAGSVSKLFTATAIMQLYGEGKIDLYKNVEEYISDIKIQNSYDDVVNCSNLLTHSSGLDEASEINGSTLNKSEIKMQKSYFDTHIPKVIIKPNTVSSYSNMGYNLLGYVVENVSGISFEEYIKKNILDPLQMYQSSVRIEDKNMASGYEYADDKYQEVPFAYQYTSGSSGIISTVTDMEHFMLMHLNSGSYNNNQIVDEAVVNKMHIKEFTNNDVFAGMAYGFIRSDRNGVEMLKHEGALPGYTTTLMLFPEENLGIYVATNSLGGLVFDFEEAFLNHFYPTNDARTDTIKNEIDTINNETEKIDNVKKYVGTYRNYDGYSQRNLMKVAILFDDSADLIVSKSGANQLKLSEYTDGKEKINTILQFDCENIFTRDDMKGYLTFAQDDSERILYAFNDSSHKTFEKVGYFETRPFLIFTLGMIFIMWIISIGVIIVKAMKRKLGDKKYFYTGIVGSEILFMFGFVGTVINTFYMIYNYDYSRIWVLKLFLTLIILGAILIVGCVINYVSCIIKKELSLKRVLIFGIIILSNIVFVITMQYFNLLGYHIY